MREAHALSLTPQEGADYAYEVIPKLSSPHPSQKRALNVVEKFSLSSLPNYAFMPSNSTVPGALPPVPRDEDWVGKAE